MKTVGRPDDAPELRRTFVAPPETFPTWDSEVLPSVALSADGRVAVWAPRQTQARMEELIMQCLPSRVRLDWDPGQKCWTVASAHFIKLARALLRRYPLIAVGRQYDSTEECKTICLNARGHICTCSCKARNHGHGKWMDGWLIKGEINHVVREQEWNWISVEQGR